MLLALFVIIYTITFAQDATWMKGTWKTTSGSPTSHGVVNNTIQVSDASGEGFTGTKTSVSNNGSSKIIVSISGFFRGKVLYLANGAVVSKDPESSQWDDCSTCTQTKKIVIHHDSLVLLTNVSGCNNSCDAETFYYRLLSEYDDSTQRKLVDMFGRPADIVGFRPFQPKEDKPIAASDEPKKDDAAEAAERAARSKQDSLDNIARIKQQQAGKAALAAQQKQRQKEINDSLNLAQRKDKQRSKDSLADAARLKKMQLKTEDSLRAVQAKQRQKDITDSINLAAQQKQRQKEINDSLNLAQQKEKQRIKDSLDDVAKLEKIRLKTEDSLRTVQAKQRQKEIADSINLAQQQKQQRLKDSLANVARIRQQQIDDSTQLALQKKREKAIADSLNIAQQKEQQRLKDSLDNVARLEKIRLKTEDSLRTVALKKRQQEVSDSITLANKIEQQHIKDSIQTAAALKLQQQKTADSLAAVRKKEYNDSLQKAALAKTVKPATVDTVSTSQKALTDRTNVLLGSYHITTPDILIELFDNGEIDGDRVSVYHNNENIVNNQMLDRKAITLNIHADSAHREHEFVLVAENLGSIPPNSALMRITVGKQIYKLSVNTDMKTNARIVFYYDGN